jgi:hypothetical protein
MIKFRFALCFDFINIEFVYFELDSYVTKNINMKGKIDVKCF